MTMPVPACVGCRQRDQRMAQLEAEGQRLRELLDEARRELHRQTSRFRRRKLRGQPKPPGRPAGHAPANRPMPTPQDVDRVIDVPCPVCPECKSPWCDPKITVQYQTDLPPITPIITQFNIESGWCPCGRQVRQGRQAEQTSKATGAAGNTLGPVVLTMAAELKHRLGVPDRKIADCFDTYCDRHVSPATLVRAEQRLTELARPTHDLLIDALRRAGVVHSDETGWRVGRLNAWLWVFSSKDVTIYTIRTGPGACGSAVPEDILGPDFDGILIVDGLKTYDVLEYYPVVSRIFPVQLAEFS